jgi:hypothetical protein
MNGRWNEKRRNKARGQGAVLRADAAAERILVALHVLQVPAARCLEASRYHFLHDRWPTCGKNGDHAPPLW